MKYTTLTPEHQEKGFQQRIAELEAEHFTKTVYIEECVLIGDEQTKAQFEAELVGLEKRISYLQDKLKKSEDGRTKR